MVVGCRRTAPKEKYPEGTRIICGKCWRLAPRYLRRRYSRLRRIMRKLHIELDDLDFGGTKPGSPERRVLVLWYENWDRIVGRATEARMGIG